jgi:signal transduction histidine kinase
VALLAMASALTACSEDNASTGPWITGLLGLLCLLLSWVAGYWVGHMRQRRLGESALREARAAAQRFGGLLDAWTWQTDASHRLQRLQPPGGAPASEWARSPGSGVALWERFESAVPGDVAGLRARLESQVPFHELRVRQNSDGSSWLLRAVPRFDDLGRFAGYDGSARPTADADALSTDRAGLQALLAALDSPALMAVNEGGEGWQLRHANAAALTLLELPAPVWDDVLKRLPAEVAGAASATASDDSDDSEREGWLIRHFSIDGRVCRLLLRRPKAPTDGSEVFTSESASFSFTISHDLRAPIRVVEGFTRILKEDYGRLLDRVGNDHLDRVLGAAARMNHMIDAMLTLAKLSQQPLARQPVNLSQLATYVVDDLRRAAPERAAEVEIEPGLNTQGDPTLLRLVLENLIGNAWKYTSRCKKAQIVFASSLHDGKRAYVVRDNGAGFDMRSADRLFGLFQRLHSTNDFPGTGVGLASVRRIILRHGGHVWADAEPGRGAAFHFTLRE